MCLTFARVFNVNEALQELNFCKWRIFIILIIYLPAAKKFLTL